MALHSAGVVGVIALIGGAVNGDRVTERTIDRITEASDIAAYQYVDPIHLLLTVDPARRYRLTFEAPCNQLRFAERIGISRSGDTIHAGFDYVLADGLRCRITSIEVL